MLPPVVNSRLGFGLFEMDLESGELWKAGFRVKLQSQPFKVLAALLERPGQIVTREDLQIRVWGRNTNVDFDHSLGTAINKIREALGDSAENPRFVETLARRGYRFIAPVHSLEPPETVRPERHTETGAAVGREPAPSGSIGPTERAVPEAARALAGAMAGAAPVLSPAPAASHFWPRVAVPFGIVAATLLAVTGWVAYRVGRSEARVAPAHITQITHNGHLAASVVTMDLEAAATDGVHLYATVFDNGKAELAAIALPEGDTSLVSVPDEVAGPTLGDISPDGSRLVLRDHLSPESEQPLWVVPTLGGSALRVGNAVAHDATWMPDGKSILYANGKQLFLSGLNGGTPQVYATLPGRASWLRWSPDGSLLRFSIIDPLSHTVSLWQLSPGNRKPTRLLAGFHDPASECCGVWTADGKWFVFQSSRGGNTDLWRLSANSVDGAERLTDGPLQFQAPVAAKSGHTIYFVGSDARSELERLTETGELVPVRGFLEDAMRVEYTRDGRYVAWTDKEGRLWRARANGGEKLQLTPDGLAVFMGRWSPDGSHMAVMARQQGKAWSIFVVAADGSDLRLVTNEARNAADPSWSPDGTALVFGRTNDRMGEEPSRSLQLLDLRSGAVTAVPGSEGLFSPRWSPDGRYIVALSLDQRKVELLDVATHSWGTLALPSGADPVWSADSKSLFLHASLSPNQPVYRVSLPDGHVTELAQLGKGTEMNAVDYVLSGLGADGRPLIRKRMYTGDLYSVDLGR